MYRFHFLPLCIITSLLLSGQAQWIYLESNHFFGQANEIICTSDGGYISIGQHLIDDQTYEWKTDISKFDNSGNLLWQDRDTTIFSAYISNRVVFEIDNQLYIGTSLYDTHKSFIRKYDLSGKLLSPIFNLNILIVDAHVASNDKVIFKYSKGGKLYVGSYTIDFILEWEVELEDYEGLIEGNGLIDNNNNYQCIQQSLSQENLATHYTINDNGEVLKQIHFEVGSSSSTQQKELIYDVYDSTSFVLISKTKPASPLEEISIQVQKIDADTYEVLNSFELKEYIVGPRAMIVSNEMIYIAGLQFLGYGYPAMVVLDKDMQLVRMIEFDTELWAINPLIEGADINSIKDTGEGILFCGSVDNDGRTDGYLNGHIGYNGECCTATIEENEVVPNFSLYPNPTSNELVVDLKEATLVKYYNIYSASGNILSTYDINTTLSALAIDINLFSKQILIVEIHSELGVFRERVIKI